MTIKLSSNPFNRQKQKQKFQGPLVLVLGLPTSHTPHVLSRLLDHRMTKVIQRNTRIQLRKN